MKQKIFFLILFLIIEKLNSITNSINLLAGINYSEETYIILYQTQISPYFLFSFHNEKNFLHISLNSIIKLNFFCSPFYFKNYLFYWTNKSFSLDIPIEYELYLKIPNFSILSFLIGSGATSKIRWDRYSAGLYYWHSELKIDNFPQLIIGIFFKYYRFNIILKEYGGIFISNIYYYNKDEFYTHNFTLFFQHKINLEFYYRINNKINLIFNWLNKFELYYNGFFDIVLFTNNIFLIGFKYEI